MNHDTRLLFSALSVLFLLLAVSLLAPARMAAQQGFTGKWKGVITQNDGGYRTLYDFEIYFQADGRNLKGRSYVKVDDIFAEMDLTGFILDEHTVHFTEVNLVQSKKVDNLEWCFKSGKLTLVKEFGQLKLVGPWEGFSAFGPCIPGRIILVREVPRA